MKNLTFKQLIILITHAFVGWALCGALIWIFMELTSIRTALIIHAIGAMVIFAIISYVYFKKFGFTTPLQTAGVFVGFVIFMDFFLVALIIEKSFEMFESLLGTWLVFILIFVVTYRTGTLLKKQT